ARGTAAAAVLDDEASYSEWASRKILELQRHNPGNDAKVMEGIRQLLGLAEPVPVEQDFWARLSQAAGGTSDGLLKLLQERARIYKQVAGFMALPYQEYESQVKAFRGEVEKSSNIFVTSAVPGFFKARANEFRIQVTFAMVRAAVEYRLHGEKGLQSVADPGGQGPFTFRRFVFQGANRGFELKSALAAGDDPPTLIFVDKEGPPFVVFGRLAGQALEPAGFPSDAFRQRYGIPRGK
ncbi:MAG: hypothetical protein NT154_40130, partial [Verrucomicrobia bacterium]|nr:hypothetical protein [Verrucomicrobiota bacterium]